MRYSRRRHPPATRRPPAPPWASCRRRSTATRRSASSLRKEEKLRNLAHRVQQFSRQNTRTRIRDSAGKIPTNATSETRRNKSAPKISAEKRSPAAEELDEVPPPPEPLPSLPVPLIPSTPPQQQAAARLAARVWIWERCRGRETRAALLCSLQSLLTSLLFSLFWT
jgi:hypothetical protein